MFVPSVQPAPIRRLRPAGIASTAVALGATVATDCLLQPFFRDSLLQRGVGAAMAASFGVAGTHWALTREPSEWSSLRGSAATGAVVLMWFMFCDRLAALHTNGPDESFALLVLPMLLVVVGAAGAMAGTLFGLTAVAVIGPVERARARTALDAPERVLLPASVWLGAWGAGILAMSHPRSIAPLVLVLLGLGGIGTVAVRDLLRLRFVTALHAGATCGWKLARTAPSALPPDVPSFGPYREATLDGLVLPALRAGGPYRHPPQEDPVARLPLDARAARAPLVRRITWCAALSAILAAITSAHLDLANLRF
ncbi:MAG: hypothetical protein R3F14_13025 [Polyangiaceae bacterium]